MTTPAALSLLGMLIALAAHMAQQAAERRAGESYASLVGEDVEMLEDGWHEIRPLAGGWGCLVPVLALIRGVGVVLALAAGLFLLVG